jgi:preprotein translocase subunit SecE
MAKVGPFEFLQQVRSEAAKVVWPSRRETIVTTIMVVLMAVFASVFFLLADQIFSKVIGFILTLGQ